MVLSEARKWARATTACMAGATVFKAVEEIRADSERKKHRDYEEKRNIVVPLFDHEKQSVDSSNFHEKSADDRYNDRESDSESVSDNVHDNINEDWSGSASDEGIDSMDEVHTISFYSFVE